VSDFFRDFRGDTIHPATTEVLAQLGLLEEFFTTAAHGGTGPLSLSIDGQIYGLVDFRHLPTRCKFMVLMPQWDFLNFLATQARPYPTFRLEMSTVGIGLFRDDDRVLGVGARSGDDEMRIRADLTVACDGRFSLLRDCAELPIREFDMPIDVVWFRLPLGQDAPPTLGYLGGGQVVLAINRGGYWQCGTVIEKGTIAQVQAEGLEAFRARVARAAPLLEPRADGYFALVNRATGLALDGTNRNIHTKSLNLGDFQRWGFVAAPSDAFKWLQDRLPSRRSQALRL
jgi:2-polyprenyl-6-methoxyphenol hydroxylase-like FAD-dependent oxidoreductase